MPQDMQKSPSGQRFELNVLGVSVAFRAMADPKRIDAAKRLIEERYEVLKSHGSQASREQLLMILLIGIADGMLHMQQDTTERLNKILLQLEEMENKASATD